MSVAGIITHILIIIVGLIILAMVLPSTLKKTHDYRKKSAQEKEQEWVKRMIEESWKHCKAPTDYQGRKRWLAKHGIKMPNPSF